jgi:hypothetical protein
VNANELEEAVNEAMNDLAGNEAARPPASLSTSYKFYDGVISACRFQMDAIRDDMKNAGEELDDD